MRRPLRDLITSAGREGVKIGDIDELEFISIWVQPPYLRVGFISTTLKTSYSQQASSTASISGEL